MDIFRNMIHTKTIQNSMTHTHTHTHTHTQIQSIGGKKVKASIK